MLTHRIRELLLCLVGAGVSFAGIAASAYPVKPIRMVVPYVAGASFDTVARIYSHAMSEQMHQQIIIDNRAGATGIIGTELVARAVADGYTLGFFGGNQALSMAVRASLPYDLRRDFAPITRVATLDNIIVVHPSLNVVTLRDLVALLKANPGKYHYGSGGTGGDTHFSGALFSTMAGVNIIHVPYKGGGLGVTGLLANEVQLMVVNMISAEPQVKAGRLKGIAIAAKERSAALPDIPTASEAGLPGFEWNQWYAVFAPAKTPRPLIARLNGEYKRLAALPEVQSKLASQGARAMHETPEELAAFVAQSIETSRKIAADAGIRINE
jgi:tripartite-type tricarboxylate transporter receptor subunit TctC